MTDTTYGIRLTGDASGLTRAFADAGSSVQQFGSALTESDKSATKILDKYDKVGAQLRQLEADFQALSNAAKNGQIAPADDGRVDAVYQKMRTQAQALRAEMSGLGTTAPTASKAMVAAFEESAAAADKGALSTAGARREMIVLAHEALTGNFARMPGSFMVLAERISAGGTALLVWGGIAALAAGAAYLIVDGVERADAALRGMNNALAASSNYSGKTTGDLQALAQAMTRTHTVTLEAAQTIVTDLAGAGTVGQNAFNVMAMSASKFAAVTNTDVDKVGPKLAQLFADPTRGAEELNRAMNFLTPTEREHIAALQRAGDLGEAQLTLANKLSDHLQTQKEHVSELTKAWRQLGDAWDIMWQGHSAESDLAAAEKRLASLDEAIKKRGQPQQIDQRDPAMAMFQLQTGGSAAVNSDRLQRERDQLAKDIADMRAKMDAERQKAEDEAKRADENKRQNQGYDLIKGYSKTYQLRALDDEQKLVKDYKPKTKEETADQQSALAGIAEKRKSILAPSKEENKAALEAYRAAIAEQEGLQRTEADQLKAHLSHIESMRQQGLLSDREALQQKYAAELDGLNQQIAVAQREEEIAAKANKKGDAAKYAEEVKRLQEQKTALAQQEADAEASLAAKQKANLDQWTKGLADQNAELEFQISLIGKNREEVQRLTDAHKMDLAVKKATTNPDGTPNKNVDADAYQAAANSQLEQENALRQQQKGAAEAYGADWTNGARAALDDYKNHVGTVADATKTLMTNSLDKSASALANFCTTGKLNFKDFARSLIADLAEIYIKQMLVWAIQSAMGMANGGVASSSTTTLAGSSGTSFAANGNTFSLPALVAHAAGGITGDTNGGVLTRPTFFAFASGGKMARGLAGEAGDEGVLPLKKTRDGRLGVASVGASGNVVVNVYGAQGTKATTKQTQNGDQTLVEVLFEKVDEALAGGIASGRGSLTTALESVYGLNRAASGS